MFGTGRCLIQVARLRAAVAAPAITQLLEQGAEIGGAVRITALFGPLVRPPWRRRSYR